LKIDILKHNLVPKHEIMSNSEIKKSFKDLDYEIKNLPKIKLSDPVSKNIDAKEGDILKITRDSQTAGTFVTYRVVEKWFSINGMLLVFLEINYCWIKFIFINICIWMEEVHEK